MTNAGSHALKTTSATFFTARTVFKRHLTHYEHAYRAVAPHADSEELTISLNNMSMCLISLNDFAQALSTYERAKKLLEARDLPLIHLITDYNIAYLYYLRGDYRRAIEMLKSARIAAEKIGYTYLVALCYLDLSDIYVELNLSSRSAGRRRRRLSAISQTGYRVRGGEDSGESGHRFRTGWQDEARSRIVCGGQAPLR